MEDQHINNSKLIRATSELEAESIKRLGFKNPVAIIPNSLKIPELAFEKKKTKYTLLFLSRLHPLKGLEILINVWARLEKKHPNWCLKIVGIDQNNYEQYLKNLSKTKKIKNIFFLGAIFGKDKENIYRNSNLFILPSYTENFGLVVGESLLQETPVITTKNTPWNIIEQYKAGWCISLDEKNLYNCMDEAMNMRPEDLREMGKNGRNFIKNHFSIEKMNEKIRKMYLWTVYGTKKPDFIY